MALVFLENTYATLEDADAYLQYRFEYQEWNQLDDTEKERLLILATKHIDTENFLGKKTEEDQPLKFPRDIWTEKNYFPEEVKSATIEQAIFLMDNEENLKRALENSSLGLFSVEVGNIKEEYSFVNSILCSSAYIYIAQYLQTARRHKALW